MQIFFSISKWNVETTRSITTLNFGFLSRLERWKRRNNNSLVWYFGPKALIEQIKIPRGWTFEQINFCYFCGTSASLRKIWLVVSAFRLSRFALAGTHAFHGTLVSVYWFSDCFILTMGMCIAWNETMLSFFMCLFSCLFSYKQLEC